MTKSKTENLEDRKYVIFEIDKDCYGIDVNKIESIERLSNLTRVPDSPEFVLGIINLRGDILPILSFREKVGLKIADFDDSNRIIVVFAEDFRVGFLIDKVTGILDTTSLDMKASNEVLRDSEKDILEGVFIVDERIVMIPNIEALVIKGYFDVLPEKEKLDAV